MKDKNPQKNVPTAFPSKPDEYRRGHTPEERCKLLLKALEKHHQIVAPEGSFDDFQKFAWNGYNGKLGPQRGDHFIHAVVNAGQRGGAPMPKDPSTRAKWIALLTATAYCYEAINAYLRAGEDLPSLDAFEDSTDAADAMEDYTKDLQKAWAYAFDAAQWEGMLCGMLDTPANAARAMGDRGRDARHEENRKNKAAVYKWADENRHGYPPTRQLNAMALQIVADQVTNAPLKTVRAYLTDWNMGVSLTPKP